jgi:hypothetical protein
VAGRGSRAQAPSSSPRVDFSNQILGQTLASMKEYPNIEPGEDFAGYE